MVLGAPGALAHHGWSGYGDAPFSLTGVVEHIELGNPHGHLAVRADGEIWDVVLGPAARNRRAGVVDGAIEIGDTVTAYGQAPPRAVSIRDEDRAAARGRSGLRHLSRAALRSMEEALAALATSPLGRAMRGSLWLYPAANVVHVLAAATLFGMILVAHLRTLGLGGALPADAVVRFVLPWAWAGFALALASGPLLFAADPLVIAANPFFRLKLLLVALAGLNALAFHLARCRGGRALRASAALSIAIWLAVLVCGRSIAYW
ncbi:MAG: DUF6152 family protein [Geminicoccaceae bacterium]